MITASISLPRQDLFVILGDEDVAARTALSCAEPAVVAIGCGHDFGHA